MGLPAPISTIFEIKDVNQCSHAYTGENFLNFSAGVFHVPKTAENGYFRGSACARGTAQTAQLRAMGIISWASRHPKDVLHPKDVPFVREFWWGGAYGLGAISPGKTQTLAIAAVDYTVHDVL